MSRNYEPATYGYHLTQYEYDDGYITNDLYAFYLSNTNNQSFVDIGNYSTSYMKDPSELQWFSMSAAYFWQYDVNAFRIGSSNTFSDGVTSGYATDSLNAIFDTGTSLLYVPSSK
jgi:hypothetical protein